MDKNLVRYMAWSHENVAFWPTEEWAVKDANQMIANGSREVVVAKVLHQTLSSQDGVYTLHPLKNEVTTKVNSAVSISAKEELEAYARGCSESLTVSDFAKTNLFDVNLADANLSNIDFAEAKR